MKSRELERILAEETGFSIREIDERMRPLRASGVPGFEGKARGLNAPDLTPHHVAIMLFQLTPRRAADAGLVGMKARYLHLSGYQRSDHGTEAEALVAGLNTNAMTLTTMLLHPDTPDWIERFEVDGEGRGAWIRTVEPTPLGTSLLKFSADGWEPEEQSGHRLVLTRGLFDRLRRELVTAPPLQTLLASSVEIQIQLAVGQRDERRALLAEADAAGEA